MATNKHAIIRFQALDKCFRNTGKKYFMEDLIEACNQAIYDFSGSDDGVKKRQIYDDLRFMESEAGYSIELERHKDGKRVYYRYADPNSSINSQPLNESEAEQLKEALFTLSRFKGLPQFTWIEEMVTRLESSFFLVSDKKGIIQFEQNEFLVGLEYISELYHAIAYEKVLDIKYQGFKQDAPVNYIVHPQFLKQYNNRWFLFVLQDETEQITNLSLDRIIEIKEVDKAYKNNITDFDELFEDVVGVSIPNNEEPVKVKLKVEPSLRPYILSKPIHGSQRLIDKEDFVLELEVYINYELTSLLMSFGEGIEVIEPAGLRQTIKEKAEGILNKYL